MAPRVEAHAGHRAAPHHVQGPKVHHPVRGHTRSHYVYYRSFPNSPWVCYGGYYGSDEAAQAAKYFRARGFDAFVR